MQHKDRFDVSLVELENRCGGQAFSIDIDKDRYGASWINQGVQGGSEIFVRSLLSYSFTQLLMFSQQHHTNRMFEKEGYHSDGVTLHVAFGRDETFWTNAFPTPLLQKHGKEIKRFLKVIKLIHYLRPFFALMSIQTTLKLFLFSNDFINFIVLPMIALFLGVFCSFL